LIQQYLDALIEWTHENDTVINSGKTKEVIMGVLTFPIYHYSVITRFNITRIRL